ncbi:uncharacterized protein LOC134232923 [Saccostrea cucullata]|uniref:uncharacterized protein LOC134232923 n=1 Tax=Saccostrea cuccullata TaxID=36930 RepID=UPI002ED0B9CE
MLMLTYNFLVTTVFLTCSVFHQDITVLSQDLNYEMSVYSPFSMVNPGEDFPAICQISGFDAITIVNDLDVKWFHNKKQITTLCQLEDIFSYKYECNENSKGMKNISFVLYVGNVEKSDEGNLTCL